ncbi:hypothetical protein PENTCL1PPCAC_8788, partial [Pristionchus entomophagus]
QFIKVYLVIFSRNQPNLQRFTNYINDNPKFAMADTASLDLCFACNTKQADVVIRKNCIGLVLMPAACRPTWCAACLARIFAVAQEEEEISEWMDGTASCPTCRAIFCANDVLLIVDEADL